jgi:hypothetical protein
MGVARVVNNIGVGKVEATFANLTTTGANASQQDFTLTMLDAEQCAACLIGNNEIGYLTTTYPLFGAVLGLSEDDNPTSPGQRRRAVVQIAGVADMQGTTGTVACSANRNRKPAGRNGFVTMFTTTNIARFNTTRGQIINVWDTDRVAVLF